MAGHLSSIEEWRTRRQKFVETPADPPPPPPPPPPAETKRLPADGGRGKASRTGGVESRTPAPARSESNTAKLREPPQNRNTRSGRLSSTQAVEYTPPASPDHLKHRFSVPRGKAPKKPAVNTLLPRARELPPKWNQPLLYPFEGAKRANVDFKDLARLNPTEFLNDNIINFYLRSIDSLPLPSRVCVCMGRDWKDDSSNTSQVPRGRSQTRESGFASRNSFLQHLFLRTPLNERR